MFGYLKDRNCITNSKHSAYLLFYSLCGTAKI